MYITPLLKHENMIEQSKKIDLKEFPDIRGIGRQSEGWGVPSLPFGRRGQIPSVPPLEESLSVYVYIF